MPNLTNQPSTSDSQPSPTEIPNDMQADKPVEDTEKKVINDKPNESLKSAGSVSSRVRILLDEQSEPEIVIEEGDLLTQEEPPKPESSIELQPLPPPPKERPEAQIPKEMAARPSGRRSVRMQFRFIRSILWAFRLLMRILFWEWFVKRIAGEEFVRSRNVARWKQYAREFRNFAADMGGVFIKAGQFISTRADIFPEEIIMELSGLQDEIPAVQFKKIEEVIKNELGTDYQKYFSWFNNEPIAAASLGQVHRAKLENGDRVVVKVQRPGIITIVDTDMAALMVIAKVSMRFKFISRRANAVEITEEFGRVLWEEVSYINEAHNAQEFARMFQNDMGIYIPMIYNDYSTDRVLVMEDVTSIKINDYASLEKAGINRNQVAKRLMNSYLRQVFDDRYFHADPHPGNLFVYPLPIKEGEEFGEKGRPFYLIYVDFGMTGRLTPQIVDGLISTLIAIVTRDAGRLIQSYQELDLLLPGADLERLEAATKAAFDQVWGMDMQDLRHVDYEVMEKLGNEFNDLLFDMPFQMPQNFIYLARTMGILSGMTTSLEPEFNPWQELQPYAEKMMRMQAKDGATVGGSLISTIFGVPGASNIFEAGSQIITRAVAPTASNDALIAHLKSGEIKSTAEPGRKMQIQLHFLQIQLRIVMRAVLFSGFLISSTLLFVNGNIMIAAGGYVICFMIGWRIMFPPNVIQ